MKSDKPIRGRLIDIRAAAAYTGLSIHTIYKMVSQRRIPRVKLGGKLLFDVALLDEWIKQNTIMPMPPRNT